VKIAHQIEDSRQQAAGNALAIAVQVTPAGIRLKTG